MRSLGPGAPIESHLMRLIEYLGTEQKVIGGVDARGKVNTTLTGLSCHPILVYRTAVVSRVLNVN